MGPKGVLHNTGMARNQQERDPAYLASEPTSLEFKTGRLSNVAAMPGICSYCKPSELAVKPASGDMNLSMHITTVAIGSK
jgi:hypothetical protein